MRNSRDDDKITKIVLVKILKVYIEFMCIIA